MSAFRVLRGLLFFGILVSLGLLAGKVTLLAVHGHHLGLLMGGLIGFLVIRRAVRFALWRRHGYTYASGCAHARRREAVML